jgi:hypothetical protein
MSNHPIHILYTSYTDPIQNIFCGWKSLHIPAQAFSEAQIEAALRSRLVKVYPTLEGNDFTVTLERLASSGNG